MSASAVAGDTQKITVTVYVDEVLLDLTPFSATFLALHSDGTSVTKTLGSGIVFLTQSGATLGQMEITILPADYPTSWLSVPFRTEIKIPYEVEIVNGATRYTPAQGDLVIKGQLIAN